MQDPTSGAYPTSRALNERLNGRKGHKRIASSRRNITMMPSPLFSPRQALAQAKHSKLPEPTTPTTPTSAHSTIVASPAKSSKPSRKMSTSIPSPKKLAQTPGSPEAPPLSPVKTAELPRRPKVKRADDSWMMKKDDGSASSPTPSQIRAMHARKRSGSVPGQSTLSPEMKVAAPRKSSEIPNTLLRKHILARKRESGESTTSESASEMKPDPPPKDEPRESPTSELPMRRESIAKLAAQPSSPVKSTIESPKNSSARGKTPALLPVPKRRATAIVASREDSSKTGTTGSMSQVQAGADAHVHPAFRTSNHDQAAGQADAGAVCKKKGHPYTSHFIPYICDSCVTETREREQQRRQRLAESLADDVLVERVKLEEWQWKTKFNADKKPAKPAKDRPGMDQDDDQKTFVGSNEIIVPQADLKSPQDGPQIPFSSQEKDEQARLKEEAEMLAKMEEANRMLEAANDATRRRSTEDQKGRKTDGKGWVEGFRRSWGSDSRVEVPSQRVSVQRARNSWRVSKIGGREEY